MVLIIGDLTYFLRSDDAVMDVLFPDDNPSDIYVRALIIGHATAFNQDLGCDWLPVTMVK